MSSCIVFGGAGFVGTHLSVFFLDNKIFSKIVIIDLNESSLVGREGIVSIIGDVRNPIDKTICADSPDWIFNFAAIHREPGHRWNEYFETNLKGARHICEFASSIHCRNIFFTSSIAVYGPCLTPTDESKLPQPITAYGGSKYPAELIHQIWASSNSTNRLIIARPGVIYGPGDPGNILRMIRAIKKGYFVFPGSKKIHKSYAYIFGFIESILFTMNRPEPLVVYNYVENPTSSIGEIADLAKKFLKSKAPIVSMPSTLLIPIAYIVYKITKSNGIHPVRVRKAGTPTHIVPQSLIAMNFIFRYDFEKSLEHWMKVAPHDFQ